MDLFSKKNKTSMISPKLSLVPVMVFLKKAQMDIKKYWKIIVLLTFLPLFLQSVQLEVSLVMMTVISTFE